MSIRNLVLLTVAASAIASMVSTAQADTTINFDDINVSSGYYQQITTYDNFNWTDFYVINPTGSAFSFGVVSGTNAGNTTGYDASFSSASGLFNLVSLYASSTYLQNPLSVTFTGLANGVQKYSQTITLNKSPTLDSLNWSGIDTVQIASGNAPYNWVLLDNITVSNATVAAPGPVAGAGVPALIALIGFGAWYRRKKAA